MRVYLGCVCRLQGLGLYVQSMKKKLETRIGLTVRAF